MRGDSDGQARGDWRSWSELAMDVAMHEATTATEEMPEATERQQRQRGCSRRKGADDAAGRMCVRLCALWSRCCGQVCAVKGLSSY